VILSLDPARVTAADLSKAADWLRTGGIVAYPTDTFYGLAVDPTSGAAVASLFDLKGRGSDAAIPLIASSLAQAEAYSPGWSATMRRLAETFWPGPLSLICDAPAGVADAVHAVTRTVAVRVPAHAVARALAEQWGAPITATSANRSGEPPSRTPADLGAIARDARVLVIDAGSTPGGLASTIVDARHTPPTLVRDGAIAWSRVLRSLDA
jgi:L-threonylcarbamoyladenylate synthase